MDACNQEVGWWAKFEGNLAVSASSPMMSAVVSPRDAGDSEGFTVTVLWERSTWSLWAFSSLASLLHTCESGSAWRGRRMTDNVKERMMTSSPL